MSDVLVTGANRGLGLEFTRQYLARGDNVIACCRTPGQAADLKRLENPRLQIVPLDVGDTASIATLPGLLAGRSLSLFINNAGIYGGQQDLAHADPQEWQDVFMVNTIAPLLLSRALLPLMDRKAPGKLVFLSSKMGSVAENTSGSLYLYRSSKAALNQVVKSLSVDLAGDGLLVAALHPGWVRTDMGGPNGLIDAQTSVSGLMSVIDSLDTSTSGHFINYDGSAIPW